MLSGVWEFLEQVTSVFLSIFFRLHSKNCCAEIYFNVDDHFEKKFYL